MAKERQGTEYRDNEQHLRDPLDIEEREREVNRISRMVKQAGFVNRKENLALRVGRNRQNPSS